MPTLKEARARRLLTVRGLAEAAGVAPSTVYLIEAGRSVPRFDAIAKLSAALGAAPEEIDEFRAAIEAAAVGKGARRRPGVDRGDGEVRNPRAGDTSSAKEAES